jgi:hypothetical protein
MNNHEIDFVPVSIVACVALFFGTLGFAVLPATIGGISTPFLLVGGMVGSVVAAIRFL